jgi:hypothetical protein
MRLTFMQTSSKIAFLVFALIATAAAADVQLAGDWRGTSLCQQKNTACHDENVLLHFSAPDSTGTVTIVADKIINGKPEHMGTIIVKYDKAHAFLRLDESDRIWEFHQEGRGMHGTLTYQGKLFRKLEITKD